MPSDYIFTLNVTDLSEHADTAAECVVRNLIEDGLISQEDGEAWLEENAIVCIHKTGFLNRWWKRSQNKDQSLERGTVNFKRVKITT